METQASIFDKIHQFFPKILFTQNPVIASVSLKKMMNLTINATKLQIISKKNDYLYADENVKPTEKNDKQPDCDTTHCPSTQ